MSDELWEVIGGADTGGIIVRMGVEMQSEALEPKLAFGSVLRQWEHEGNRLQYELLNGSGPATGWVSIKVKNKDLVVKYDKKRAMQQPLGTLLPPIPRKKGCPGSLVIPNERHRGLFKKWGLDKARQPLCYVIVFPGAEDEVYNGWFRLECEAPSHLEMGVYEWPGHGSRHEEPFAKSLRELVDDAFETFKDAAQVGHFAVVGHSIGALVMTGVCERFQRELRRKPLVAYTLDRGAPHLLTLSDPAFELLVNNPTTYMEKLHPNYKPGSKAYETRLADQPFDNEVFPIGFYRFRCLLRVFISASLHSQEAHTSPEAQGEDVLVGAGGIEPKPQLEGKGTEAPTGDASEVAGTDNEAAPAKDDEETKAVPEDIPSMPFSGSLFRSGTSRPWTEEDGELWSKWGDKVSMQSVHLSHFEIRLSETIYTQLYDDIQKEIKSARF